MVAASDFPPQLSERLRELRTKQPLGDGEFVLYWMHHAVRAHMPPLYRIDVGKEVFYAIDDDEKTGRLDQIAAEKLRGKVNVQRFKGLGEMNPLQLRETTIAPETRRLVRLAEKIGVKPSQPRVPIDPFVDPQSAG